MGASRNRIENAGEKRHAAARRSRGVGRSRSTVSYGDQGVERLWNIAQRARGTVTDIAAYTFSAAPADARGTVRDASGI